MFFPHLNIFCDPLLRNLMFYMIKKWNFVCGDIIHRSVFQWIISRNQSKRVWDSAYSTPSCHHFGHHGKWKIYIWCLNLDKSNQLVTHRLKRKNLKKLSIYGRIIKHNQWALQTATILVTMASEKYIWRLNLDKCHQPVTHTFKRKNLKKLSIYGRIIKHDQ